MTPADAVRWLLSVSRFERSGMRPGLERIRMLLDALGHPERELRILHVGGTNGKGSVSALAEAILRAAGLRTGLYTSPHLLDATERIRLHGAPIAGDALAEYVRGLKPHLETSGATFFEAVTALALAAFHDARVEAAVLEVGLGGRWDATNVGTPLVSVITRIDYDHQEYLGTRLAEIAGEKAAIVKPRTVALSAAQAPEAAAVIEAHCRALGVPLLVEGRDLTVRLVSAGLRRQRVDLAGPGWRLDDVELALPGLFQPGNAVLAVGAVREFARVAGVEVGEPAVRAGCAGVHWPGRFQVLPGTAERPTLVLDGAHNPAGAAALAASLAYYFPGRRRTLVLGVSIDKDHAGIVKALLPVTNRLVLAAAAHPRATPPAELLAALPPAEVPVTLAEDLPRALTRALGEPGTDVVVVAGSLFLVADALRWAAARGLLEPEEQV